jgi:hypothetical protein
MEAPIGSVIAFAGEVNAAFEATTGWMLCDGRLLDGNDPDFVPLFNAIRFAWGGNSDTNMFNIPDLIGRFLRGVEREQGGQRDPDGIYRDHTQDGGHRGRAVGSLQDYATAAPLNHPFVTDSGGSHDHGLNFEITATRDVNDQANTVAYPAPPGPRPRTDPVGDHLHLILGGALPSPRRSGDSETRPRNCYVHWIIRFN